MSLVGQGTALLVSFPVVASVAGALVAAVRPPGPRVVSAVQHFAAGVVTAALVGEIMPELRREGPTLSGRSWGFVAGAVLVLALGAYGRDGTRAQAEAEAELSRRGGFRNKAVIAATAATLPIGMLGAMAVDLLLDGVLVGLGARLGFTQGSDPDHCSRSKSSLGPSVVAELKQAGFSARRAVLICTGLGLMTAVGAIGAALLLAGVSTTIMSAVLAFGAAALLYLVVEELLVEAPRGEGVRGAGVSTSPGFGRLRAKPWVAEFALGC